MDSFWYRMLVRWYRLTGNTEVQAEWKARQALSRPGQARDKVAGGVERARDQRYNCVCGQLLVVGDKKCHACGRRQWAPHWMRSLSRLGRDFMPGGSPVTILCAGLMLLGYLAQVRFGGGGVMNPTGGVHLVQLGAFITPEVAQYFAWAEGVRPGDFHSEPWRAVAYTFLHGGLWHIGFNLYALSILGPLVEKSFGPGRTLFAWVFTGALAVVIPGLIAPRFVVGASGATFGLMGMAIWWGHRVGTTEGKMIRDVMIRWAIYCTIFGLIIGAVAHDAHFIGMAAGVLLAMLTPPPNNRTHPAIGVTLGLIGLGVLGWTLFAWGSKALALGAA